MSLGFFNRLSACGLPRVFRSFSYGPRRKYWHHLQTKVAKDTYNIISIHNAICWSIGSLSMPSFGQLLESVACSLINSEVHLTFGPFGGPGLLSLAQGPFSFERNRAARCYNAVGTFLGQPVHSRFLVLCNHKIFSHFIHFTDFLHIVFLDGSAAKATSITAVPFSPNGARVYHYSTLSY